MSFKPTVISIITVFLIIQCGAQFLLSDLKLPGNGMRQHFAGVYNDSFTILGGSDALYSPLTKSLSRSTTISPTFNGNQWSDNTVTLPLNISGLLTDADSAITIGENMYIINPQTAGGTATSHHQMLVYNLRTNQYTVSSTPTYLASRTCSVYNSNNNIIYTIGGHNGGHKSYTQRFNVSTNTWITPGGDIVNARCYAGCSMDGNNEYIYIFGGYSGSEMDGIERYTVANNAWTVIPETLSSPRNYVKCRLLSTDGNIYCIAGADESNQKVNTVDVFDPSTETIINTMYLNQARYWFTATLWNDNTCIIISGGYHFLDSIETFGDCTATTDPSAAPTSPTLSPTNYPTAEPTSDPTIDPTNDPTVEPTSDPTINPTVNPTINPTIDPTINPSINSAIALTSHPTQYPTTTISEPTWVADKSMFILVVIVCIILGLILIFCVLIFFKLHQNRQTKHNTEEDAPSTNKQMIALPALPGLPKMNTLTPPGLAKQDSLNTEGDDHKLEMIWSEHDELKSDICDNNDEHNNGMVIDTLKDIGGDMNDVICIEIGKKESALSEDMYDNPDREELRYITPNTLKMEGEGFGNETIPKITKKQTGDV